MNPENKLPEQQATVKHTAGPWAATKKQYGTYTEYVIQTVAVDHKKTFIGEVGGGLQDDSEIRANAELIARAPELERLAKFWHDEAEHFIKEAARANGELERLRAEKERRYTQDELLEAFEAGASFSADYHAGHRGKDYKTFKKELDAYRSTLVLDNKEL